MVLIIEKDFSKNMARAIPAPVKLVSDSTRDTARRKVTRARRLVITYSSQLAAMRLIARGIAPSVAMPVSVEDVEVSSAQERLAIPAELRSSGAHGVLLGFGLRERSRRGVFGDS